MFREYLSGSSASNFNSLVAVSVMNNLIRVNACYQCRQKARVSNFTCGSRL